MIRKVGTYEEGGLEIMTDTVGLWTGFGQYRSLSSIAELDETLDEVTEQSIQADDPVAVSLFYPDDPSDLTSIALLFGLGRPWSFLGWVKPGLRLYVPGAEDDNEASNWWFSCDYSEYPPGRGVPLEIVRGAAREFFRTGGEHPQWLNWINESSDVPLAQAS